MSEEEMARRMQEEHAAVDRLARGLREWVAAVPKANYAHWIDGARQRFDHLRAHLTKHFAMEAADGYMKPVVQRRPTLSIEVDRLAHEHEEMIHLMSGIHRDLQELKPTDRLIIRDCCRRMESFLAYLDHHEDDENMLISFVFAHNVGTKD